MPYKTVDTVIRAHTQVCVEENVQLYSLILPSAWYMTKACAQRACVGSMDGPDVHHLL